MKKQNFFKKIYSSITTLSFYTSIIHERFIRSFIYLIIFTLLLSLPYSIYIGNYAYKQTNSVIERMKGEDFPSFHLEDGQLIIEGNTPFVYSMEDDKLLKIIIDNSNTYTFNDLAGYYLGYLITPKSIIQSQLGTTPQTISYSDFFIDEFNKDDLLVYIKNYQPLFAIFFAASSVVFTLIGTLFKSLLSYFLVSFFKNIYRIPLSGVQSYKIAIYSMTTPLIVLEALKFANVIPPTLFFGVFMFINAVYIGKILNYFSRLKTDIST